MSRSKGELLDHEYDGIKELDNDLPPWWLWLFYLTVIWAVLYFAYYHVFGFGYSQSDEYMKEVNPNYTREMNPEYTPSPLFSVYRSPWYIPEGDETPYTATLAKPRAVYVEDRPEDEPEVEPLTDPGLLAEGERIYREKCATCHGFLGEGGVGPNLTDDYWLHGSGVNNVLRVVKFGVPAKGMIAWRGFLSQEEIHQVASYVLTLHGTKPPNPKAPEGVLVE